jgi:hypothetical protein
MSRYSIVQHEAKRLNGEHDGIDDRLDVRVDYALQIDDSCTTVEACLLSVVHVTRRSWEGAKLDELKIAPELLLPLYHALGDVIMDRERVERQPEREPELDEIEQPDASTGQTFTVDEGSIVGGGE